MRSVSVLGATGSIGRNTLDLVERNPDRFDVVALTANRDVAGLAELALRFRPRLAVIADAGLLPKLEEALAGTGIKAEGGPDAVIAAAELEADWTMAAIVGTAGLEPTMRAIEKGGIVALANKEALISAGALMTGAAQASGATLLPVDSEHNAIYQCFDHARPDKVRRIILTASGGPFRGLGRDAMRSITPAQAVAHPNWSMGAKISVDCATLMNKGLELIEAFHLFPVGADALEVVVHRQSIVHSLVEYVDGSLLAQLGPSDMRVPIAYTLAWPERMATPCTGLDLAAIGRLDFEAPDLEAFPALALAREALVAGGAKPAILNAANEIGVASFLENRLAFLDIASLVAEVLTAYDPAPPSTIDEVLEVDRTAREMARERAGKLQS